MKMYRSLTELIGHTPLLALTGYCRENGRTQGDRQDR